MKALASTIKMRSLTYAIIGSLLLVVVQSQVNNCGQLCINNLLAKAPALGCSSNDAACVCKNVDFGYGLRDCAIQACGAAQEAAVLAYGTSYCQSALAAAGGSDTSVMGTVSIIVTAATSTVTETSSTETAPLTSATTPGSGGGGGGVGGTTVGITTEAIVTTISTGSSYRTETTETTVFYTISSTSTTQAVSSTSRPASSSPSTSSPTSTPAEIASSEGLTSGAEAGIGVGAVLGVIIALSLAFFCFRKRKKQSEEREIQDLEIADPLAAQRGHELITSAHTHEMDAQRPINVQEDLKAYRTEGFQELEAQNSPPIHSTIRPEDPAEMDAPYNIQSTNVGLDWKHLQPSELDASASAAQRAEFHSVPTYSGSVSTHPQSLPVSFVNTSQIEGPRPVEQGSPSTPAASSSSPSNAEDKLEVLRKRMERVREDKERLEKIQALKDLEAELQAEILAVRQFDTGKSHVK